MTEDSRNTTATGGETGVGIEQWDLTHKVSPYLDRHMIFPLLEYLDTLIQKGTISYDSKDVAAARLALLRPTHMVDYAGDVYKSIHSGEELPDEMKVQKEKVYKTLEELRKGCEPFDKLCEDKEERVRKKGFLYVSFLYVRCVMCAIRHFSYLSVSHNKMKHNTPRQKWPQQGNGM